MRDIEPLLRAGGKSSGLRDLPDGWTIPFFSISDELFQAFKTASSTRPLREVIDHELSQELSTSLSVYGDEPEDVVLIVRSDALNETLETRGKLSSHKSDATIDGVLDAAEHIFRDAGETEENIFLIVQRNVSAQASGHFSNELRVARDARSWLCEIVNGPFDEAAEVPEQVKLVTRDVLAASPGPLLCATRAELITMLRRVGKYFYDRRLRRHLEWVWDGRCLYIVQSDPDLPLIGASPLPQPSSVTVLPLLTNPKILRSFDPLTPTPWQKLDCVTTFARAGMQTAKLFYISGDEVESNLKNNNFTERLASEITCLLAQPIVIRTDLRGETAFLLPRTDIIRDLAAAQNFIIRVLDEAKRNRRPTRDVCFIIHQFIPAAAAAFSFAKPGERRVRVDAIWGLPDGLEFCIHDSYEVDAKSRKTLDKRIRFKSTFLANLPSGEWRASTLAAEFAWRESISFEDVLEIAVRSQELAEQRKAPVVIMWFARIPASSGHPSLIAWRLTEEGVPREVAASASSHFFDEQFEIRNDADVQSLIALPRQVSSIVFRPDGPHLRDEGFLKRLADLSNEMRVPIQLEGSFLSHAYYVLTRSGARVTCFDPMDPQPVKTSFRKLVRDRIPVKIERNGEVAETTTLLPAELLEALRTKLVEESLEVLSAAGKPALTEEMADVYEVLRAMCRVLDCSMVDIERIADVKRKALGGFEEGIVLVETKDMPLITVDESSNLFEPTASSPKRIDVQSLVSVAGRKAKSQIDRILLPLVPPVPGRHRGPMRVDIRQLDATFRIVYGEKSVEVILDGRSRLAPRGQLDLFSKR